MPIEYDPPHINGLRIAYSWACNARCEHCSLSSGPERNEHLDGENVLRCIEDAAVAGVKWIGFTGGEIMLFQKELFAFMEKASYLGLGVEIVTNAFWAQTKNESESIIDELKARGLKQITISTDEYHAKYVEMARVENAIDAAKSRNVECSVNVCAHRVDGGVLDIISSLYKHTNRVHLQIVTPIGRAEAFRDKIDERLRARPRPPFKCKDIYLPLITATGLVVACCSTPGTLQDEMDGTCPLILGQIKNESLLEILCRARKDPLLGMLATEGLAGILKMLGYRDPEQWRTQSLTSRGLCDMCMSIFTSRPNVSMLRRALQ